MSAARSGPFSDFRAREIAIAVIAAIGVQAGAVLLLRASSLEKPAAAPEIDKGPSVPVKITPVLDLDAPALKLGGKRDKTKLPDRWVKPKPKKRVEEQAFVSPKAGKTEEDIPKPEIPVADAGTPPPPEAEVTKSVETPIEEIPDAGRPTNAPVEGHEDGVADGTETDPLKGRAVDIYRDKIRSWFSRRFRVSGTGLSADEITKFRVAASVTLSGGRQVVGYSIVPSGNEAFDAAARSALEGAKGQEIPPPPENYPDIVQTQISLTFTCTPQRCD
ncbi:TonB C-terminal domain-containing protein [Polyangium aurulentum]|uniref:TonB C-terminal domain-containing protein n=1 Tax=Polyangium aurulentum TaxID=2567896 RepID=UPI0010AE1F1A|nr:TonB C-terminal domain-containing protein [Polyangium aurulentum]UQA61804.1 TonB C-terminal domain-containing protein [Polyangium aurulentum]